MDSSAIKSFKISTKRILYQEGQQVCEAFYVKDIPYIKERRALFKCKCGGLFESDIALVKKGSVKSCGCIYRKPRKTIKCACGCEQEMTNVDRKGRCRKFIHGHNKGHSNMFHSEESKQKIRIASTGRVYSKESSLKKGYKKEKNPNWKGGVTPINELIRKSPLYKEWRKNVFKRDNYTCQWCREKESVSGKLNADHIKPFAYFPKLRFDLDNGRTLCVDCHKKTDTYLIKAKQKYG